MRRVAILAVAALLCGCSIDPKDVSLDRILDDPRYSGLVDGEWFTLRYEVETTPGKTHTYYVEIHDFAGYWFDGWKVDFTAPAEYETLYLGRFEPKYRPINV